MSFEVNTLFLLTVDVEVILGLLLLLVWVQNKRVFAVAWWASAHLLRAVSVLRYGMYGSVPDLIVRIVRFVRRYVGTEVRRRAVAAETKDSAARGYWSRAMSIIDAISAPEALSLPTSAA